ncbi:MAG: tripartite tricarboxylate transporter substrate-binding protein [Proteobacteria bacterium]|nr:tripartite tricarboxylate transporter substrate-binding protein [Pseudomonadota bacterium]
MKVPEIRERLMAGGAEPQTSTPEEFAAFIRAEIPKWARVIKSAGVDPN